MRQAQRKEDMNKAQQLCAEVAPGGMHGACTRGLGHSGSHSNVSASWSTYRMPRRMEDAAPHAPSGYFVGHAWAVALRQASSIRSAVFATSEWRHHNNHTMGCANSIHPVAADIPGWWPDHNPEIGFAWQNERERGIPSWLGR